jgi:hypothetical protein
MTLLIRKLKLKTNSYENKKDAVPKMMLFKKYTKCIKERIPTYLISRVLWNSNI